MEIMKDNQRGVRPSKEMCTALQGDVYSPPWTYVQPSKEIYLVLQLFHLPGLVGTWVAGRSLRLAVLSGRV